MLARALRCSSHKMHLYSFRTQRISFVVKPRFKPSFAYPSSVSLKLKRSFCSATEEPTKHIPSKGEHTMQSQDEQNIQSTKAKEIEKQIEPHWSQAFFVLLIAISVGGVTLAVTSYQEDAKRNVKFWKFRKMANTSHRKPVTKAPIYFIERDRSKKALKRDVLIALESIAVTNIVTLQESKGGGKSTLLRSVIEDIVRDDAANGIKRSLFYFQCINSLKQCFGVNGIQFESEAEALDAFLLLMTRFAVESPHRTHCFIDSPAGVGREPDGSMDARYHAPFMRIMKSLSDECGITFYCLSSGGDRNIFTKELVDSTLGTARVCELSQGDEWNVPIFLNDDECYKLLDVYCKVGRLNWSDDQKKYVHSQIKTRNITHYLHLIPVIRRATVELS